MQANWITSFCKSCTPRRHVHGMEASAFCSVCGWFNFHDDVAVSLTTLSVGLINRYSSVELRPVLSCAVRGCCLRRHDAEDRLVGNVAPDPLYNCRRRRPVYRTTHSAPPMMTDDAIGRQPCTDRHTSTTWQRDVTTRIVTWVGWLVSSPPPPHNSRRFTRYPGIIHRWSWLTPETDWLKQRRSSQIPWYVQYYTPIITAVAGKKQSLLLKREVQR